MNDYDYVGTKMYAGTKIRGTQWTLVFTDNSVKVCKEGMTVLTLRKDSLVDVAKCFTEWFKEENKDGKEE